ncbi:MAG: bifunctional phosphoribosylaminoimidazolecarboxamide formyltransferase/IMP cyclohydrolase, partial [Patescibacteria group bacterium]
DLELRRTLASKAFSYTAYYDSVISDYFTLEQFPEKKAIGLSRISSLRYGENPHQKASVYKTGNVYGSVVQSIKLQGKELSYNNYLDIDSAWGTVCEFDPTACVIVKHNNPCGVATGDIVLDAYKRALTCDSVSAFGGIVAFNCSVDKQTAEEIIKLFTECIIAPDYSEDAMEVFSSKKDLRVLKAGTKLKTSGIEYRTISGGMLIQDRDSVLGLDNIKTATERKPTEQELESLKFAWRVCKNVKSNTIVLTRGTQTVGIGAGQMSRIDALRIAVSKMNSITEKLQDDVKKMPLVLASDAFFPFGDVPEEASKVGVTAIIQPGGSLRDDDSISVCNKNKIAMVFTGMRHFRH